MEQQKAWYNKNLSGKQIFLVLGLILFGVIFLAALASPSSPQQATVAKAPTIEALPKDPKELIKYVSTKSILERSPKKDSKLRNIDIDDVGGAYDVIVDFNADGNLTQGLTKQRIKSDSVDLMRSLYTLPDVKINKVVARAYMPLVDKYGNESIGAAYIAVLDRGDGYKINWSADIANLQFEIVPNIWRVTVDLIK